MSVQKYGATYTGRFIMCSGIAIICYRKTVGHVFTKPVQTEGTTQKFFPSKWFKQFTETGCLCKQKSSGRPLTAEDDVERVRASFLRNPKKSTGTADKVLSMSKTTVWRVLRKRFIVINVCNHGEYYETPRIYIYIYFFFLRLQGCVKEREETYLT
jgi:hypothetical protein